jgi:hypothetical protein
MNDTEMTQEQKDAEMVGLMREAFEWMRRDHSWTFDMSMEYIAPRAKRQPLNRCADAALRTIDRLTAKAAAYDTLRAACAGVPEHLIWQAYDLERGGWKTVEAEHIAWLRSTAEAITAALAAPADGSADADADAADGSGVRDDERE